MLIINGLLIDPKNKIETTLDLRINNGRVEAVAEHLAPQADEEIIDAKGLWVIPGAIDLHVHLREPGFEHKETIETGTKSAAKGGVTTVCAMPNTNPVVDSKEIVQRIYASAKEKGYVNVLQVGAITKGQKGKELSDIKGMVEAGICALSEDGRTVMDSKLLKEAMELCTVYNIPMLSHCEDEALAGGAMNEGTVSKKLGLPGILKAAEDIIASRDIQLAAATGCKLHLCHVSTKGSVEILELSKKQGISVTAEVCPHHFTLTDEAVDGINTNTKMNPPLREQLDVDALKQGLKEDAIDAIATDHAPHHADEKARGYVAAPNGIIGLETMIPLTLTQLYHTGILTKTQCVEKLSTNPAAILGIDKGHLSVGAVADITLIDPSATYVINIEDIVSKSKNTPFVGTEVTGKIIATLVAGKKVYPFE